MRKRGPGGGGDQGISPTADPSNILPINWGRGLVCKIIGNLLEPDTIIWRKKYRR